MLRDDVWILVLCHAFFSKNRLDRLHEVSNHRVGLLKPKDADSFVFDLFFDNFVFRITNLRQCSSLLQLYIIFDVGLRWMMLFKVDVAGYGHDRVEVSVCKSTPVLATGLNDPSSHISGDFDNRWNLGLMLVTPMTWHVSFLLLCWGCRLD